MWFSIELLEGKKKVYSFQIAERSSQLEPSNVLPWIEVEIDAWNDLLALPRWEVLLP